MKKIIALALAAIMMALCLAGAMAGKIFLDHTHNNTPEKEEAEKTQIAGNNNFFGEEDCSEK